MIDKYFCPIYNCIILPVVFLTTRYKNSIHFIQFVIACYLLTTRNIVNIYDKGFEDKNNVNLIQSSNDYVHDNEAHFHESYRRYVIWPLCKGVTLASLFPLARFTRCSRNRKSDRRQTKVIPPWGTVGQFQ